MKAILGWDYNTWCRCHYYGEFGHIGENCVKHHNKKKGTTRICFFCIKLGHLAKNCMNTRRIEDENKEKDDNIKKQMRQQWIPKSLENASSSNNELVTQGLSDITIST